MVLRSSRIWSRPKKKLSPTTIYYNGYKIMSDGTHCFYLCETIFNFPDGKTANCEFTARKDKVHSEEDLQHRCFPPSNDIRRYGDQQDLQTDSQLQQYHISFVGKSIVW